MPAYPPDGNPWFIGRHLMLSTSTAGFSSFAQQDVLGDPYSSGFFRYVMFRIYQFFAAYLRYRDIRNRLPDLATKENYHRIDLCFRANFPNYDPSEIMHWAKSPSGQVFCTAMLDRLMEELDPDEFILLIFSLLSYYRILNGTHPFVPTRDCGTFYSELWKLSEIANKEENGNILERVAFAIIDTGSRLQLPVITVPYLRPYQLNACMEHNASTAHLDVYCYARISRLCSHQMAISCIHTVFGTES